MATLLLRNIRQLVQTETEAQTWPSPRRAEAMRVLPSVDDAWLLIEGERILDFGPMSTCPERADEVIDVAGGTVLPAWCDSHTHLVFAGSRETEFVDRIHGLSYEEIARRGGGILNSARRLQDASEDDLFEQAWRRLEEVKGYGTGAIEIKSGYGLTLEAELKMLRVAKRLAEQSSLSIKTTLLGAHALPQAFKNNREDFVKLVIEEMIPRVADEGLAEYIDVFCEKNFFSVAEADQIMAAGLRFGLKPKIHTNQFNSMGGIQAAVQRGAISVDHLEVVNQEEIDCLRSAETIATLLPSAPFFLNDHYPPAREMLDAGVAIALATDFNPGSTPSGRMPFVLSLACIKLRMTPEEAINAATINGAAAMELADELGSIRVGKIANLLITSPISSLAYIPYAFGSDLVKKVILRGEVQ